MRTLGYLMLGALVGEVWKSGLHGWAIAAFFAVLTIAVVDAWFQTKRESE